MFLGICIGIYRNICSDEALVVEQKSCVITILASSDWNECREREGQIWDWNVKLDVFVHVYNNVKIVGI